MRELAFPQGWRRGGNASWPPLFRRIGQASTAFPSHGAKTLKTRAAAIAALLILGGCSQAQKTGAGPDRFAGLDGAILKWRTDILASDPLCGSQAEGQKCQAFEVACKAERTVTPADRAKGITAHVVTAMTWNGWDPKLKQEQTGSRTAEFNKTGSGWTRADHAPVNMESCADL